MAPFGLRPTATMAALTPMLGMDRVDGPGGAAAPGWGNSRPWRSMATSSQAITSTRPRLMRAGTTRLAGARSEPLS
jgi:hypothetical protein